MLRPVELVCVLRMFSLQCSIMSVADMPASVWVLVFVLVCHVAPVGRTSECNGPRRGRSRRPRDVDSPAANSRPRRCARRSGALLTSAAGGDLPRWQMPPRQQPMPTRDDRAIVRRVAALGARWSCLDMGLVLSRELGAGVLRQVQEPPQKVQQLDLLSSHRLLGPRHGTQPHIWRCACGGGVQTRALWERERTHHISLAQLARGQSAGSGA